VEASPLDLVSQIRTSDSFKTRITLIRATVVKGNQITTLQSLKIREGDEVDVKLRLLAMIALSSGKISFHMRRDCALPISNRALGLSLLQLNHSNLRFHKRLIDAPVML
jgi:hypothetical protein